MRREVILLMFLWFAGFKCFWVAEVMKNGEIKVLIMAKRGSFVFCFFLVCRWWLELTRWGQGFFVGIFFRFILLVSTPLCEITT